uniref:Succinate dehydrogenase subunit b560 n=1 Tax=Chlamydomonas euryale TaxID=1486919 RepID=A0A7R9VHH3_9CHLO|mmetsp:Transcript_34480/g.102424  ORF Transcript_34480/g.102424 Transcript_34480/m.102424 type:complete len:203 (+) Transcript_34480:137-745(+)
MLRRSGLQVLRQLQASQAAQVLESQSGASTQQFRGIGGDKIPEFWGKPSAYTEGTGFLGTPTDHLERIKKRPLSPDVLEIDGKSAHYKFPLGALSSIANRITGVALSVGFMGAGYISLTGNLTATVAAVAGTSPILLFPFKFAVAYTILYHYLGAVRHFAWDHGKHGNQADKNSLLELNYVEMLSKGLFVGSGVLAFIAACM